MWNRIDCALMWPNGKKAYFFHGNEYVRYDIQADRVDDGYPLPIQGNWRGLSLTRVDAAIVWPTNNKAYLFGHYNPRSDGYVRFDVNQDQQDPGYPTSVESNWRGLQSPIDAVVLWPNGKAYFFQGLWYSRYDMAEDRVDQDPLPIRDNWPGIPIIAPAPQPPPPHEGENPGAYHCHGRFDIDGRPDPDGPHECGCWGYIGPAEGNYPCSRSFEIVWGPGGERPPRLTCNHPKEYHYSDR